MKQNPILDKSIEFAIEVINFSRKLQKNHQEYILSKQLIRSGTSIGANISEANYAQSKPDFIHKLSISLKEANETKYWLTLLSKSSYNIDCTQLSSKLLQIIKILTSIIVKSKQTR
jgi:four helix bundle protein